MTRTSRAAFTMVEIMVAVTIVGILAAVTVANFSDARAGARDSQRKSDLKTIQAALELYKQKYGRYPEGCNAPGNWSGQANAGYACSGGDSRYIMGNPGAGRPFSEFLINLPTDPQLNGANSGYVYTINPAASAYNVSEGMVYKLMALDTVETETLSPIKEFSRCGNTFTSTAECSAVPNNANQTGSYTYNSGGGTIPSVCTQAGQYRNDYAVFGGFADGDTVKAQEFYTDSIKCK